MRALTVNPSNDFTIQKILFGVVKLTRKSDKRKFIRSDYGIAFDGSGVSSFSCHEFARNFLIFGVKNRSSKRPENVINNSLVLGRKPTEGIKDSGWS